MPDEETTNWLETVSAGGVTQILLGPAGAAISRLFGAAVDIPATWLDGFAQKIRDKTNAQSVISQAIAGQVAQVASQDPAVLSRAMNNLLAKEYRSQTNKDEVAKIALQSLDVAPPPNDSVGPSDQFMTVFERYAQDATSSDLREMFGRLLADEIRHPMSVAAATLHFVSMLDQETAQIIQRVLPHCTKDIAFLDNINPKLSVAQIAYLEQAGFWSGEKTVPIRYDERGHHVKTPRRPIGYVIFGEPNESFQLNIALLSRSGRDLMNAVTSDFDFQAMANTAYKHGAKRFSSGPATYHGDQVSVRFETEHYAQD